MQARCKLLPLSGIAGLHGAGLRNRGQRAFAAETLLRSIATRAAAKSKPAASADGTGATARNADGRVRGSGSDPTRSEIVLS